MKGMAIMDNLDAVEGTENEATTSWLVNRTSQLSSRRRRSQTVAVIIAGVLIGTLGACTSADDLGAANVWPLTRPEASVGGVALSVENGARWTADGLQINGTGYATTSAPGPVATDSSFTVSAWVRPMGHPREYAAVLSQSGNVAGAFFLGVAEGFWSFSVKPADGNGDSFVTNRDRASAVQVKPDAWVHLAGVYDSTGGRARFFLNGYPVSVDGVATDPLFAAKGPMLFGRGQANGELADSFEGTLTDVRTWPRALDPQELTAAALIAAPRWCHTRPAGAIIGLGLPGSPWRCLPGSPSCGYLLDHVL